MTDHIIHSASTGSTDRWDNEGGQMPPDNDLQHELELYGIAPVQLTVFDWGGYRYTNASDAIAAAKRAKSA